MASIVIVMEVISTEFRVALPWELLYSDDTQVQKPLSEQFVVTAKVLRQKWV